MEDSTNDKKFNLGLGIAVFVILMCIILIKISAIKKENYESGHATAVEGK
jgi:hypothetical protein